MGARRSDLVAELADGTVGPVVVGPGGAPYVTAAQLAQYVPAATLNQATLAEQNQACLDATEEADSYFRARYSLPLLMWGNDVTRYTAYIAIYLLMSGPIGFAPQAGSDDNFTKNYYRAVGWPDKVGTGWFPGVARQAINPDVTPSVPDGQDPVCGVPQVFSNTPRGWTSRTGRGVGNI
jgi:phage gp36-like protein